MKFTLAVLSNVLFATSAIAKPTPGLARRLARRAAERQGMPIVKVQESVNGAVNNTQVAYSTNWSGAVHESPPSGTTFTEVTAEITVPSPSVPSSGSSSEYAASAWVGIDGDTYQNAILQTGVDFYVTSSGSISFDAWYEWYPDYAYDFSSMSVSAGDVIKMTVKSSGTTSGTATIENVTTGQTVSKTLSSSYALGGQNAEWIVEDFESGGSLVAFADFGTVLFTGCVATTSSGSTEGTSGSTLIDLESSSGTILTTVTLPSSSEVKVVYQ